MAAVSLRLRGVGCSFDGRPVVEDIDLELPAGGFVALVGPSGCGKTTLLRVAGGLLPATRGEVRRIPADGAIGVCFQEPRLLPWRNLLRNVELPMELAGRDRAERRRAAEQALALVGLGESAGLVPRELSGGMRMRAALARSLVAKPGLLLLDEPFAAVDEVSRFELDEELDALRRHEGLSALLVTHSIQEACFLADEILVLSPRPARVLERFSVAFGARRPALRSQAAFAALVGEVHAALREGRGAAS